MGTYIFFDKPKAKAQSGLNGSPPNVLAKWYVHRLSKCGKKTPRRLSSAFLILTPKNSDTFGIFHSRTFMISSPGNEKPQSGHSTLLIVLEPTDCSTISYQSLS